MAEQQKIIWEMSDLDSMPPWKILIAPKVGGLLIVAFDRENPIAHAIFTHAHDDLNSKPYLYLDMIGVLPEHQGHKIGEDIILKSREFAGNNDYTSIQWTFDPLEGANANLYIGKLGATVTTFYPNYYGELTGRRHQGSVTDRFLAKLEPGAQPKDYQNIDAFITQQTYNRYESLIAQNPGTVAIEFPADLHALLSENGEKAHNIRQSTGNIFMALLSNEYCINGFLRKEESNYYVAEKIAV